MWFGGDGTGFMHSVGKLVCGLGVVVLVLCTV
mgnify:CR=1 FL=1